MTHRRQEWRITGSSLASSSSFAPSRPRAATTGRQCEIVRLLPAEGSELQYRVKSNSELFERVAKESKLSRRSLSETAYNPANNTAIDCRSCGACCSFSKWWPRFSIEEDADLDRIPIEFVDRKFDGMRCVSDRCSALAGEVGVSTECQIYALRPAVCRACAPGDDACRIARDWFGLRT
jgi:uncharacterized protein